jgi:hypothetical protein
VAISGILVPLDGAALSAAILPVVASLARPIHASVHLFPTIDLQKREIPSLYYSNQKARTHRRFNGQPCQNQRR